MATDPSSHRRVITAGLFGTAPIVAAWLVSTTGNAMAFSWYMILASAITFAVTFTLPKTLGRSLT